MKAHLEPQNPWQAYSSLLYMGSGFNLTQNHSLSIVNTSPGSQLVIDYALLTVARPSNSM